MNRTLRFAVLFAALGALLTGAALPGCSQLPREATLASEVAPMPESAPTDDGVRERVIIGPDNRRRTPANYNWVTRTVGQLEAPRSNNRLSRCTATAISPRHVLTSAHCVYEVVNGQPRLDEDIYFYPGANQYNQMPYGRFRVTRIHHPESYDPLSSTLAGVGYDIAVLEVGTDDTGRDLARRVGFRGYWGTSTLQPGVMTTLGYPGDKTARVQYYEEDCAFDLVGNTMLRTYCDVFSGQSGSPALVTHPERQGESFIHAVISGETTTANYATRIHPERQRIIAAITRDEYNPQTSNENERWRSITLLDSQRINVVAHNTCRAGQYVGIQYLGLNGDWATEGFYQLAPGDSVELAQTRNSIFYVHAHDLQGNVHMEGGHRARLHGNNIGFRQMNHSDFGDVVIRLCN
ncbi:MAG: trypsin-like serine protease [Alcanivorax sp.]|nr:trypsin-like serine protease [Alcanivorax sp.]